MCVPWETAIPYMPANDLIEALCKSLGMVMGLLKAQDGTSYKECHQ
jgi:hypothetical protein